MKNILFALVALVLVLGCIGGQSDVPAVVQPVTASEPPSAVPTTAGVVSTTGAAASTQPTQGAETTMQSIPSPSGQFLAKESDVPAGSTFEFDYNGGKAILVNFNGEYVAYVNFCPHKGGPNKLVGDKIVCEWHGSQFSPADGSILKGPATTALERIPVEVIGDSVYAK
ncbi:MAG: Rieske (2Fe-2S) protein [Candidatus Altiarchaeota archaeon]|nr:Rieske (2Fe-2S) protein [Candidatus Altiarchaeota archaeon]